MAGKKKSKRRPGSTRIDRVTGADGKGHYRDPRGHYRDADFARKAWHLARLQLHEADLGEPKPRAYNSTGESKQARRWRFTEVAVTKQREKVTLRRYSAKFFDGGGLEEGTIHERMEADALELSAGRLPKPHLTQRGLTLSDGSHLLERVWIWEGLTAARPHGIADETVLWLQENESPQPQTQIVLWTDNPKLSPVGMELPQLPAQTHIWISQWETLKASGQALVLAAKGGERLFVQLTATSGVKGKPQVTKRKAAKRGAKRQAKRKANSGKHLPRVPGKRQGKPRKPVAKRAVRRVRRKRKNSRK